MRYDEFTTEKQRLDELLPLIPAIAGGVARAAVGGAAKAVGKAAARGVGKLAKKAVGIGKTAAKAPAAPAVPQTAPTTNDPNAKVDTQPAATTPAPAMGATSDLRPGGEIDLPTKTTGGMKKYRVTKAQGDDIEIEDPQAKPGEPQKMVYKKGDIERAMMQ